VDRRLGLSWNHLGVTDVTTSLALVRTHVWGSEFCPFSFFVAFCTVMTFDCIPDCNTVEQVDTSL